MGFEWTATLETVTHGDFAQLTDHLATDPGRDPDFGADRGAVGHGADAFDLYPGIAIALVMVKEIVDLVWARPGWASAIGDEQVEEPIVIIIDPGTAGGVVSRSAIIHDRARRDSREGTVTFVVVEKVMVVVVQNEQIQIAVVVVIAPRTGWRSRRAFFKSDSGDFAERTIPVVAEQETGRALVVQNAIVGDEQIEKTIIVIVAPSTADRIRRAGNNASGVGHPLEFARESVVGDKIV